MQIYPTAERTSYARAHVEVQERLDGQLVVCYKGKILSPGEAPSLASELRAQAEELSQYGLPAITQYQEPEVPENTVYTEATRQGKIWYEDSEMRQIHRELVKAGMERARQQGKRIGRPRAAERSGFAERFDAVMDRLALGMLSRYRAAKELGIGYATLMRLLNARSQSIISKDSLPPIEKAYAEVLH